MRSKVRGESPGANRHTPCERAHAPPRLPPNSSRARQHRRAVARSALKGRACVRAYISQLHLAHTRHAPPKRPQRWAFVVQVRQPGRAVVRREAHVRHGPLRHDIGGVWGGGEEGAKESALGTRLHHCGLSQPLHRCERAARRWWAFAVPGRGGCARAPPPPPSPEAPRNKPRAASPLPPAARPPHSTSAPRPLPPSPHSHTVPERRPEGLRSPNRSDTTASPPSSPG